MRPIFPTLLHAFTLAACTAPGEPTDFQRHPILNGESTSEDTSVVALRSDNELCTGFVVGPDLVLTARHCVSAIVNPASPCLSEDGGPTVTVGADVPVSKLGVYGGLSTRNPGPPTGVAEILWPVAAEPILCGHDLALLRLTATLSTTPIALRLDGPPVVGEVVRAVGYGAAEGGPDRTSGVRRASGGHTVRALGPALPRFFESEWSISEGPCGGDSGGPALDAQGRAIGVMSRGDKATCTDMIYERVDTHGAWLGEQIRASYVRSGVALPAWLGGADAAAEASTDDAGQRAPAPSVPSAPSAEPAASGAGPRAPTDSGSGCALHGGPARGPLLPWALLALPLFWRRRRR